MEFLNLHVQIGVDLGEKVNDIPLTLDIQSQTVVFNTNNISEVYQSMVSDRVWSADDTSKPMEQSPPKLPYPIPVPNFCPL